MNWDKIKYFKPSECACKCCGTDAMDERVVVLADNIRAKFGKPIKVNCGARCTYHNKEVGGEKQSYHISMPRRGVLCKAMDITADDLRGLLQVIYKVAGHEYGVIEYDTFVHIDCRDNPYRESKRTIVLKG
jgi:uncharacterized protein YcbK (DUF882 family)